MLSRILLLLLPIGLIWGGIGAYLTEQHGQGVKHAVQNARTLDKAFEENMRRSVEAIDTTIRAMRMAWAHDPAHFDLVAWDKDSGLSRELALQLSYTDAAGLMAGSNLGPVNRSISLADRPHFKAAKAMAEDGLYISDPVIGRVSGRWSVQFARKLVTQGGGFDGIVVGSLDPMFLMRFYQSLDIGDASLLLLGMDGVLKAGASQAGIPPGMNLSATDLFRAIQKDDRGTIVAGDVADHTRRIYSWRVVRPYDLVVVVGLSWDAALGDYHRHMTMFIGLGALLTIVSLGAGATLIRSRKELVLSRAVLQGAVENISQGLLVVDAERAVPVMNARAAELLGLPEGLTYPGVPFDRLLEWQMESGEFDNEPEVRALVRSGGIGAKDGLYRRTRRNGTVLEFQTKVVGTGLAVRTITDITEQEHNARVLAEARDAAEAAARARSEFLAVMSHEIRTPLNGVIGVAGLLEGMELGEAERDYVRLILRSGDHLLGLINDILDYSRLDAAKLQLESVSFDPRALAEDMVTMLRPQAVAKGLKLSLRLDPAIPRRVIGDPGRLRQVLINLVGNAIKFTDQGSVRMSLDLVRDGLEASVADTGIGIAPDAIERMFAEFTQADGSISRRYGGSGLGLAICRRLVELMGGAIAVESEPGKGSLFRFHVPLPADGAAERADAAQDSAASCELGIKILVAEDDATNRLVALRLLERMGCKADAVCNGAEAVETLKRHAYDLVLMDVMMPEMDGLTATRAIRDGATADRHIPIVGLTAHVQRENMRECLAAGMDAVTTKPVTAASLRSAIHEGLAAAEERVPPAPPEEVVPRLAELVELLGEEAVKDILATFAEDTTANLVALREAAERNETERVYRLAHSVAGAARNMGAARLAALASALERNAGALSAAGMVAEAEAMQVAMRSVLDEYGVVVAG